METNTGLKKSAYKQSSQKLGVFLADTYVLYTKTQNFHWNVVDPRFYSLHLFLEKQYEELAEKTDEIAERIRMLGERSPGGLKEFLALTSLKESKDEKSGNDMIQTLLEDHESVCRFLRKGIEEASNLGDEGTADLFIQHLRFHEKSAWMLRSQLE